MKIRLQLHAGLSRYLPEQSGRDHALIDIRNGATVGEFLKEMGIPADEAKLIFLNGVHAGIDAALKEGDRVGIFPAVGGG